MVRSLTFIEAGHTEQMEKIVNPVTGKWRKIRFPATVAIIEHSSGGILLYDTGYSPRFYEQTKHFPEKAYALVTPVSIVPEETAHVKMKKLGLNLDDVQNVVLSHFHADHIAGAADFNRAKYIFSKRELQHLNSLHRVFQVKHGYIAGLLPSDIEMRAKPADEFPIPLPELGDDWFGKDIFGDESVFVVPLPGHTLGQLGLYIREYQGKSYLLVADAAWLDVSIQENIPPIRFAQEIFFSRNEYITTLNRVHNLYQKKKGAGNFEIIACHCDRTAQRICTHV